MATVLDLFSRRLLACPNCEHPNARLVCDGIKIAAAVRGGRAGIGIRQSMGRVGSCFDNAAAESFFSTLEHEVLSRHHFTTKAEARSIVLPWCHELYNTRRRHSSAAMMAPIDYEHAAAQPADGQEVA